MTTFMGTVALAGVILMVLDELFEEDTPQINVQDRVKAMETVATSAMEQYRLYKRGRVDEAGDPVPKKRRVATDFNWERGRMCVHEDFMSPTPIFNDRQFERTFRLTCTILEAIALFVGNSDPFFRILAHDEDLRSRFRCPMMRSDARRVSAQHQAIHQVWGMVGSIDCMHVPWRNCPVYLYASCGRVAAHRQ